MGTIVNAGAIAVGSLLGLLIRRGLSARIEEAAMKLLGLCVFIIGLEGVLTSMLVVGLDGKLAANGSLLLIVSVVIGGVVGELGDIDGALNRAGKLIEQKFGREGFAKGFVSASLVFCVGAMAIVGALSDGLAQDASILYIKSSLDAICSVILASTLGFGVFFSFLPVLVYQGTITLLAGVISPLVSDALLRDICMVGYAIVICIGINFLKFTKIRTANLLPALLIPILYAVLQPLFAGWGIV